MSMGVMREATIKDYWRKCSTINHQLELKNISIEENNILDIEITKGIFSICGLNGVGKSTLISYIKDLLGLELNSNDMERIKGTIKGTVLIDNGKSVDVKNKDGNRLKDLLEEEQFNCIYLDNQQAISIINRLMVETNLDEFLEQYEEVSMSQIELKNISYIVGKEYDEVYVTNIEEENVKFPFFRVKSKGIEYNSKQMGLGEHILFYYYNMINNIDKNGICIIEEPENFISVRSQQKLMNYIAMKIVKSQNQFIITTHSPFIIKKVPQGNIILLNKYKNDTFTYTGEEKRLTKELGLEISKKGIMYVEDRVGELFIKRILKDSKIHATLEDYDIKSVKGEGNVTLRIQSPCEEIDFDIIGVFDGDMKSKVDKGFKNKVKWKYIFLPGEIGLEEEFKCLCRDNIFLLAEKLKIEKKEIVIAISKVDGMDSHDWFNDLCEELMISDEVLFESLYYLWLERNDNEKDVKKFLQELEEIKK